MELEDLLNEKEAELQAYAEYAKLNMPKKSYKTHGGIGRQVTGYEDAIAQKRAELDKRYKPALDKAQEVRDRQLNEKNLEIEGAILRARAIRFVGEAFLPSQLPSGRSKGINFNFATRPTPTLLGRSPGKNLLGI